MPLDVSQGYCRSYNRRSEAGFSSTSQIPFVRPTARPPSRGRPWQHSFRAGGLGFGSVDVSAQVLQRLMRLCELLVRPAPMSVVAPAEALAPAPSPPPPPVPAPASLPLAEEDSDVETMNWIRELISLPRLPPLPPSDTVAPSATKPIVDEDLSDDTGHVCFAKSEDPPRCDYPRCEFWDPPRSLGAADDDDDDAADALAADGPPPAAPAVPAMPVRRARSRSRSARSARAVTGAAASPSKSSGTTGTSDGSAPARAAMAWLTGASDGAAAASSAMASGTTGASDGAAAASALMVSGASALSDGGASARFSRELLAAMVFQRSVVSAIWWHSVVPSSLLKAVASNRDVAFDLPTVQPETRDEWVTHCIGAIRRRSRAFYIGISEQPLLRWEYHACDGFVEMHILLVASSSAHTAWVEMALIASCRGNLRCSNIGAGGERASRGSPHYLYVVWRCNALMRRARGGGRWTMSDCSVMGFLYGADWHRRLL